MAKNKKNTPINTQIKADSVMVIDNNGCKLGVMTKKKAIDSASAQSLDLVQVSSSDADPVVCKMLDFGKYIFEKKKNLGQSKNKTKKQSLKEIKFRPNTDIGDFKIKLKKIKGFINDGNKTKISVRFRGREILNSNLGLNLLERVEKEVAEIAQVDQEPSLEGRQLLMIISPIRKK
ncbi:MAG: translation initiation factor IF-3 [Gammaproteobacteria bacterium]